GGVGIGATQGLRFRSTCVSVRDAPRDIDTIARMTTTRSAAAMRAAAVGLSPKIRVDSVLVRGDAATPSRRSVRVVALLSVLEESEDDVPGVVTCASLLARGCADGALGWGGVVVVWASAPAAMPSARTNVSVLIAKALMSKPSLGWDEATAMP